MGIEKANPYAVPQPNWLNAEEALQIVLFKAAGRDEKGCYSDECHTQRHELGELRDDRDMRIWDHDDLQWLSEWLVNHGEHTIAFRGGDLLGCFSCLYGELWQRKTMNEWAKVLKAELG